MRTTGLFAVIALAALLLTAGCAVNPKNKTLIVVQNPETKEIIQCKGDPWASWDVYAQTEACAKAYEKAGWVRLGDY